MERVWVGEEILAWLRDHARWLVTLEGSEYVSRQWAFFADEVFAPENDTQTLRASSLDLLRQAILERYGYLGDLLSEPPQVGDAANLIETWRVIPKALRH